MEPAPSANFSLLRRTDDEEIYPTDVHCRDRDGDAGTARKCTPAPAPIIGVLDCAAATPQKLSAFYEGLQVKGFSRNQNLTVEYHSAEGDYGRLPELAADLIKRRVTLINAFGSPAALAAKAATTKIPVVFAVNANPSEIGLVASLNHPGTNMTGVAGMDSVGNENGWNCCARRFQPLYLDFFSILRIRIRTR